MQSELLKLATRAAAEKEAAADAELRERKERQMWAELVRACHRLTRPPLDLSSTFAQSRQS